VSEKEALHSAADEARKVARAARELGVFLDEYAKYLTQPSWRERAVELHLSALNKLSVINAGLITCSKWVAESSKGAIAQPLEQPVKGGAGEKRAVPAPDRPRAVKINKKGSVK
jgi:hypothetical protein